MSHPERQSQHRVPIDPDLSPDDPGEPSAEHRPAPQGIHRARQYWVLAAIAVGGFIGATGRYELGLAWKTGAGHIPWATFVINTSGAFLLGLVLTLLLQGTRAIKYLQPFLCVGVLGAWTTMSTFAVDADLLIRGDHPGTALAYVAATVFAGLTVTWLGIISGRALARTTRKAYQWASR